MFATVKEKQKISNGTVELKCFVENKTTRAKKLAYSTNSFNSIVEVDIGETKCSNKQIPFFYSCNRESRMRNFRIKKHTMAISSGSDEAKKKNFVLK